jgi:hypothetical protein
MIVTLQAPSSGSAAQAQFEAIKYGLDCEVMPDNVLDLTVADVGKAVRVAAASGSKIISVHDRVEVSEYGIG